MSRRVVLDELTEAVRLLESGFYQNNINSFDLSLLAKYFRSLDYGFLKIKEKLIEFCKSQDEYFNLINYDKLINVAVNSAKKYKSKGGEVKVVITKAELDVLKKVSRKFAQILFVMLVVSKHEKFNSNRIERTSPENIGYFFWYRFEDAVKIAGIRATQEEIFDWKYELDMVGAYIAASLIGENNWRICFANDNSEPVMYVDSLINIVSFLPYFCEMCGKIIEKKEKSNHHTMHKECYLEYRNKKRMY